MPLTPQNVPVSFLQGLDTKDDRKQVILGRLLVLENAIFQTPGELRKRNGYMNLSNLVDSGTSVTQGKAVMTFQEELLEFDGTFLYSYSESTQKWTNKGRTVSLNTSLIPIIRNTFQQTSPDFTQHSTGLQAFVWEDSRGGVRYSVIDSFTEQAIVQDALLSVNGSKPKAMNIGQYILLFYVDVVLNHLRYVSIPVSDPLTPSSPVDVATDINVTNPNYDCVMLSTLLFVAYNNTDMGGGITLKSINQFLVLSSPTDVTGENADGCITIISDNPLQQLWVIYYNGTDLKYFVRDYTTGAILVPTVIETVANVVRVIGAVSGGSGSAWYEISAAVTYNHFIKTDTLTNTGTVGTPSVFKRSVGITAKPFVYNSLHYFTIVFDSPQQPTYFVINTNGNIVAKAVPSNGGGLLTKNIIPESVQPSTGLITFALLSKDLLTTISGQIYTRTGVSALSLDFVSINTFYRAELGNNLHMTGGVLEMYDGVNVVEHNFNIYPEGITNTSSNAGGSLGSGSVATTYQYSVTYEWTDNQGQIHRSFPSIPDANTTVSFSSGVTTGSVILTIPTLRLSQKNGVRIVVYRTEGNGTIFYQTTSTSSPLLNNPAVDTVTFTDTQSDANLIGNPLLYTTGGVLANFQAPSSKLITTYKNRVILVPSENQLTFQYSKTIVQGAPVEFAEEFIEDVDQRGGNITGIEQLDDKLILFKQNNIFYELGDGPDNTGANNDFSFAQLITTDGGCTNARSIVTIPLGLMYQSAKGIYLLGRDLSVKYIGADVEAYNSQTITAAKLIPTTNQVRFTLASGTCLVYDYYMSQWGIFTNHQANDATLFQDLFSFVDNFGMVHQETPGQFTDNGQFIKLRLVTSWLSLAGLQGFQRAYRALILGEYISPHQLLVQVAYDFNPTFVQQEYINSVGLFDLTTYGEDSPYGNEFLYGGEYPYYQFRINFWRQKCQAIQLSLEDVQSSNFGQGLSLSAFNLQVGAKKGSNKVPTLRTFG